MLLGKYGWAYLGLKFIILGIITLLISFDMQPDSWWLHGCWCILGGLLLLPVLIKLIHSNTVVILSDHRITLILSFALYFLYGAAMLYFATEDQISNRLIEFPVDAQLAMRIDAMNAIGLGIILVISTFSRWRWLAKQVYQLTISFSNLSQIKCLWTLMLLSCLPTYYVFFHDINMFGEGDIISGIWRFSDKISLVMALLSIIYRGPGSLYINIFSIFYLLFLSITGVILFSKQSAILPLITIAIGLSIRYNTLKILPIAVLVIAIFYNFIGGPIAYSRINFYNISQDSILSGRINNIISGIDAADDELDSAKFSSWGRLCYIPSQAAALYFYDIDNGGKDFQMIPLMFVPRFILPNKENTTATGTEFYYKITGQLSSSTGTGIFFSGYYSLGWLGLILSSCLCGWLIAQTSTIAFIVLSRFSIPLIPFAFAGNFMAFRIDGSFLSDYLGFSLYIFYPIIFLSLILKLLR